MPSTETPGNSPALHVQIIHTRWTKQSRGAPGATARARVPLHFFVAPDAAQRGSLSVEIHNFDEEDFKWPAGSLISTRDLTADLKYAWGGFVLDWDGKTATTHLNRWFGGDSEPRFFDRDMGRYQIAPDGWVRLRWHGRLRDYDNGQWWYEHTVVNVARCDADLNVDFAGKPARTFEWLPNLR